MCIRDRFQIVITLLIYMLIVIPIGIYLYRIAANKHTFADPVFDRVDNAIYRVSGINPEKGMNWKTYVLALVPVSYTHLIYTAVR